MLTEERKQFLEKYIVKREFKRIGVKTTVCCLTLYNGFEVVGSSAPLDVKQFNEVIGESTAYMQALGKLDEHYAFVQHDQEHEKRKRYSLQIDEALKALEKRNKKEQEW